MKGLFGSKDASEGARETGKGSGANVEEKSLQKSRFTGGSRDNINAFLGKGTTFKGSLTFEGTVRVDGKLEGEVFTKDTLVIGESSTVEATVRAGDLIVSGTVRGNVTAERKVELHAGARLFGNISTPSLVIAEGVVFEGNCTMGQKQNKVERKTPAEVKAQPQPQKIVS